ncbi:hypothetical protein ACKLNO_09435 [Neisseriaceae bacterium B1]
MQPTEHRSELFIESGDASNTFGHGSSQMSDSMMVASLFFSLDNKLNIDIQTALKFLNPILQAASLVDTDTLEHLVYSLNKLFLGENAPQPAKSRNDLYEQIMALKAILPNGNPSEKEKFENEKGTYQVTSLVDNQSWQAAAFQENNPLATAIRYTLKELNPFAIAGVSAYSADLLTLYSASNIAGMTEMYIQQRATMLSWKNAFDTANISYDTDFGAANFTSFESFLTSLKLTSKTVANVLSMIPKDIQGDWTYSDATNSLSFHIDGKNLTELSNHYVRFGTDSSDKPDTLEGDKLNDYLFGGAGNDTLNGGAGDDYLEGGKDFDTYHIQDNDTIFDADASGQIIFSDGVQAALFKRTSDQDNLWLGVDASGNVIANLSATRVGNDLHLSYTYAEKETINDSGVEVAVDTPATEQPIIKDFFVTAKNEDGQWSGLGIQLNKSEPSNIPNKSTIGTHSRVIRFSHEYLSNNDNNLSAEQLADNRVKAAKIVSGSLNDDNLFNGSNGSAVVYFDAGNDVAYGGRGYDWLFGEDGNDVLYGSALSIRPAQFSDNEDHDYLVGGLGNDLIYGVDGDDVIYTEDDNTRGKRASYLSNECSNQRGDWASGGKGNDQIYVGQNKDFLLGGEGNDIIRAGASDDVVVGDAHIFPNIKLQSFQTTIEEITNKGQQTLAASLSRAQNLDFFNESVDVVTDTRHHTNQNAWTVQVDKDNGQFTVAHALGLRFNETANESLAGTDYLFGGAGNDLVIGQGGNDFVFGEEGDDILWGDDNRITDGDDAVVGNDFLSGSTGKNTLNGGKGV